MTDATTDRGDLPDRDADAVVGTLGAVHLGLSGAVALVSGLVLAYLAVTEQLLVYVLANLDEYYLPVELLRVGNTAAEVATTGALLVAVGSVVLGLVQLALARAASRRHRWRATVTVAALGLVHPLVAPLSLIAVTTLVLARSEFRTDSQSRSRQNETSPTASEVDL